MKVVLGNPDSKLHVAKFLPERIFPDFSTGSFQLYRENGPTEKEFYLSAGKFKKRSVNHRYKIDAENHPFLMDDKKNLVSYKANLEKGQRPQAFEGNGTSVYFAFVQEGDHMVAYPINGDWHSFKIKPKETDDETPAPFMQAKTVKTEDLVAQFAKKHGVEISNKIIKDVKNEPGDYSERYGDEPGEFDLEDNYRADADDDVDMGGALEEGEPEQDPDRNMAVPKREDEDEEDDDDDEDEEGNPDGNEELDEEGEKMKLIIAKKYKKPEPAAAAASTTESKKRPIDDVNNSGERKKPREDANAASATSLPVPTEKQIVEIIKTQDWQLKILMNHLKSIFQADSLFDIVKKVAFRQKGTDVVILKPEFR